MANKVHKFHISNKPKPQPTLEAVVKTCRVGSYELHDCGDGNYLLWRYEGNGVHRLVTKGRFQYYV